MMPNQARNLPLYLAGKLVSQLGTHVYNFGVSLFVLKLTGSALLFSVNLALGLIPQIILAPIFGTLVDRSSKKPLVVGADTLSGLIMIGAATALSLGAQPLTIIFASTFSLATSNALFSVSMNASIRELFDLDDLNHVGGLRSAIDSSAMILGPILGGVAFAFLSLPLMMVVNGLSFIGSAISELFLTFAPVEKSAAKPEPFMNALKSGLWYLLSRRDLKWIVGCALIINFFAAAMEVLMPFILVERLKLPAPAIGWIEGAFAIGMLLMSLIVSRLKSTKPLHQIIGNGVLSIGLLIGAYSLPLLLPFTEMLSIVYFTAVNALMGAAIIGLNVPLGVSLQKTVAPHYMGRVSGLLNTGAMLVIPISQIMTGFALKQFAPYQISLLCGVALTIIGLSIGSTRDLFISAETTSTTQSV